MSVRVETTLVHVAVTEPPSKSPIELWLETLKREDDKFYLALCHIRFIDPTLSWLVTLAKEPNSDLLLQNIVTALGRIEATNEIKLLQKALTWLEKEFQTQIAYSNLLQAAICCAEIPISLFAGFDMPLFVKKLSALLAATQKTIYQFFYNAIKEIAKFEECPEKASLLKKGLEELCKIEPAFPWYDAFFSQFTDLDLNKKVVHSLQRAEVSGTTEKIVARYRQIRRFSIEEMDAIGTAYYIERQAKESFILLSHHHKKSGFKPAFSLQQVASLGDTCLLLKSKPKCEKPLLYIKSSYKKVTAGIYLPHEATKEPFYVTQSVNLTKLSKERSTQEVYEEMCQEVAIHKKFQGKTGIWPILDVCYYKKNSLPMISLITPLAKGNLYELLFEQKLPLTDRQLLGIFSKLTHALCSLHEEGYIHGDLKLQNVVMTLTDPLQIGLIDFGYSFRPAQDRPKGFFEIGFYGSRHCTAPEMLEHGNCSLNLFQAELFALGFLLYSILLRDAPPWSMPILDNKILPFPVNVFHEVLQLIQRFVEAPLTELQRKKPRSLTEELTLFTYKLMQIDPLLRADAEKAKDAIRVIEDNFSL